MTRSVTRSRPRPPVRPPALPPHRAARATVSADQPWTAPRAAPRLPARPPPSQVRVLLTRSPARPRTTAAPASPPPLLLLPLRRRRSNSFSLLLDFLGGGEGERGKVGRRGPRGPQCDRGAGSDRRPSPCCHSGPRRPGLGPAASAALGLLLRRELAGAAHSSTGRCCAAHPGPRRRPPAGPPDTPPRRTRPLAVRAARPADTPPRRPRAWPRGAPRPKAQGLAADSWPGWGAAPPGNLTLIRAPIRLSVRSPTPPPDSRPRLIKRAGPAPSASFFYKQIAKVTPSLSRACRRIGVVEESRAGIDRPLEKYCHWPLKSQALGNTSQAWRVGSLPVIPAFRVRMRLEDQEFKAGVQDQPGLLRDTSSPPPQKNI